jgi:hypothetical protein
MPPGSFAFVSGSNAVKLIARLIVRLIVRLIAQML